MAISISTPTAYFSCFNSSNQSSLPSLPFKPLKFPPFWPWQKVKMGPLTVSPMGFGTWAWGNQLLWGYQESMDTDLQQTFNLAVENGINLFDTADSYGTGRLNGQSEKLLGKFIQEFPGQQMRNDIVIATKFAAYPWRLTPGLFVKACKASLERLQVEQIGIGQLHWSTANYAPPQELALWDGLVAMYEQGLVRAVGVSNYGPKQLIKIHDYLKARGVPLCSAQVQFSLLSMGEDQMEIKKVCDSLGIRLIAYSPLGLGMLTGKYTKSRLPLGPRAFLFRQILPGLEPLLNSLGEIAQRRGKTLSQVSKLWVENNIYAGLRNMNFFQRRPDSNALIKQDNLALFQMFFCQLSLAFSGRHSKATIVAINWCICKGAIPIPGIKTVKQAEENLGALGWRLSSDELLQLEYAASESPQKMIQNIFQTRSSIDQIMSNHR
ncbi:pyridoxal reductase [Populus alba x Populus x berolinensis]|uniref:Pyridoxal reductase n=1 Tax=Populus alba x Populus x berolinensis TaxID=444605 RepID=A0AAD6PXH9_9ROSI|nr:pyridoxal reductase [Populus alba x Populus x berolinensis]